jgi:hypothetical protein
MTTKITIKSTRTIQKAQTVTDIGENNLSKTETKVVIGILMRQLERFPNNGKRSKSCQNIYGYSSNIQISRNNTFPLFTSTSYKFP